MKQRIGDLLVLAEAGEFDVIIHGCNCFHTFGAGIARAIKQRWPATHYTDVQHTAYGDRNKLGSVTTTQVSPKLTVVNAYTQFGYGSGRPNVDYEAIRAAFRRIKQLYGNKGLRFGIPKIGAGLAGGDWNIIAKIVDEVMEVEDITVVILPQEA
jgi:O-acetyl-ADP-ribose deacetylase (regulator of RNase III)